MNNASMNSGPNTAVMNWSSGNGRRAARADRRALRTELAGFVTPADRLEIELIAGRYSDEESREVRVILLRQDVGV
jgi:hypothetical protein